MTNYLVITGGSKGIGKQTVAKFLQQDWKAINLSRKPCDLPGVINIHFDLTQPERVGEIAAQLHTQLADSQKICLVHNAAILKRDEIANVALDNLNNLLIVNVVSPVALNQIIIPKMQEGSSIVYIGSTLSEKGVPGSASYIISKHAVVGMMRATSQDLAEKGITSCCICPGLVETEMLRDNIDEQTVAQILETSVLGKRVIQPEEMADVIYFCGTNPLFNGSVLHANLGQNTR